MALSTISNFQIGLRSMLNPVEEPFPEVYDPEKCEMTFQKESSTDSPSSVHDLKELRRTAKHAVQDLAKAHDFASIKSTTSVLMSKVGEAKGLQAGMRAVLLCMASILIMSTYLEDMIRMVTIPGAQINQISVTTGLPQPLALLFALFMALAQLSSVSLLVPLAKWPSAARFVTKAHIALATSVILQPILFGAWTFELLSLSVTQLGALAIFYVDAYAVQHPEAAGSRVVAIAQLSARLALASDLVITCFSKAVGEGGALVFSAMDYQQSMSLHMEEKAKYMENSHELRQIYKDLKSMVVTANGTHVVGTNGTHTMEDHRDYLKRLSTMSDLLMPPKHPFHDAHTTFAAIIILCAALMVWAGFKTRPTACVAAFGAFVDAVYRYPFLTSFNHAKVRLSSAVSRRAPIALQCVC